MYYVLFLVANAVEMIWESRIAARNSAELMRNGAREIAPRIFPLMVILYLLMYAGSLVEFTLANRRLEVWWIAAFSLMFAMAKLLKFWAVRSLGRFWTMKVLVIPGAGVVNSGPYRYVKHPNYIAVLLEIAATTLLGKAFATFALVFVSFSVVLFFRIHGEEMALAEHTDYANKMNGLGRFIP